MSNAEVTRLLGFSPVSVGDLRGYWKAYPDYGLSIGFDDLCRVRAACFVRFASPPEGITDEQCLWFLKPTYPFPFNPTPLPRIDR
jgi:hypothetical protein